MEDVTITTFNVGHIRFDLSESYNLPSDHPMAGQVVKILVQSFHIGLSTRSVLVDAVDNELEEFPIEPHGYDPPPLLLDQLVESGIDPTEITDVIITHAHFDHYGGICTKSDIGYGLTFPNARHYLGAADWRPEEFGPLEERSLRLAKRNGLLELVEGQVDLGDGLTIFPLPGETPGHQMLQLEIGGKFYYFAGDLYHDPIEFGDLSVNVSHASVEEMRASKQSFMETAATTGGLVYFTHVDGSFRIAKSKDGTFTWERES